VGEINSNLTYLKTLTENINETTQAINSTVSTILLEVDDLEELHQCSINPNSTICTLLNNIYTDTQNIYDLSLVINTTTQNINQTLGSDFHVQMSNFGEVAAGSNFLSKIWITDYLQQPKNASSIPTITLYDPLRNTIIQDIAMTYDETGIYSYAYATSSSQTDGVWEAVITTIVNGVTNKHSDYWELESSPAEVTINSMTDTTTPTITADTTITNEGSGAQEYQYEYCVVAEETNSCGGGDDLDYASGAKLIQPGDFWNTQLSLDEVTQTGTLWFKLIVYYGTEKSGASQSFTATGDGGGTGGSSDDDGITGGAIIRPEHIMDLSTRILDEYKFITPGGKVLMEVTLYNFGTEEIKDLLIKYCIETNNKEIIKCNEETTAVHTKVQLVKEFLISQSMEPGEYFIKTEASYGNETVYSETTFEVVSEEELPSLKPEFFGIKTNKTYLLIGVGSLFFILLLIFVLVKIFKKRNRSGKVIHLESKLQHLKELKSRKEISKSSYHSERERLLNRINKTLKGKHLVLIIGAMGLILLFSMIPRPSITGAAIGVGESNLDVISWWAIFAILVVLFLAGIFAVLIYILKEIRKFTRGEASFVPNFNLKNNTLNKERTIEQADKKININCSTTSLKGLMNKKVYTNSGNYIGEVKEAILRENRIDQLMIQLDKRQGFGVKGINIKYNNVKNIGHVVVIDNEILEKIKSLKV